MVTTLDTMATLTMVMVETSEETTEDTGGNKKINYTLGSLNGYQWENDYILISFLH